MRFLKLSFRWWAGRFRKMGGTPSLIALLVFATAGGLTTGCSNIESVAPAAEPITDPTQLYMRLRLEDPAVALSTADGYQTIQLVAVPRDALGHPMTGLPAPTYRLVNRNDSTKVRVTADGLVTAISPAAVPGIRVEATLTYGPVTHKDTARIVVQDLANPPTLANLSFDMLPPDSAIWARGSTNFIYLTPTLLAFLGYANSPLPTPQATDSAGNAITGLPFRYTSLDPAVATLRRHDGVSAIGEPGVVRFVVQTNAYGIAMADTLAITVTWPIGADVGPVFSSVFRGGDVRIAPHGHVSWVPVAGTGGGGYTGTGDTIDIVFNDPTQVAAPVPGVCDLLVLFGGFTTPCEGVGGNGLIVDDATSWMIRRFPEPGIYPYHSVRRPEITGRVIVTDDLFDRS